jgi:hypothetical protein
MLRFDPYSYADEKLRSALRAMISTEGTLRDKLVVAYQSDLRLLHESYFPEGEPRDQYCQIITAIMEWAPKGDSQDPIVAAIEQMDDYTIASIIERIDSLAFGIEGDPA